MPSTSKVGLLGLDAKSILRFGQPVILHCNKTSSNLHYRCEPGFVLVPDEESYGYLTYVLNKHRMVASSNYAFIRKDANIYTEEKYENSVFGSLILSPSSASQDDTEVIISEPDQAISPMENQTQSSH